MGEVQVFVVRVWRQLNRFRASVRGVDEEAPRFFEQPEQVSEFLRHASEEPPAAAESPPTRESGG